MIDILFWVWLIVAVVALLAVGIFRDEPQEIVLEVLVWPAMAVIIIGCAIRDLFDWANSR